MTPVLEDKLIPIEQAELIARLRWFIQLRWVFGAASLGAAGLMLYLPLGHVHFQSEPGVGTTVTLALPLAHPDSLKEVESFCRLPNGQA